MAVGQTHDDCVQCHGLQTKRSRFCHTSHACHMTMHAGTLQVDYHSSNPQLLVCAQICQRLLAEVPFISALCTCFIELHQPDGLHEGLLAGGDTRSQRWQGQAGQAAGSLQESCKGIRLQALQAVAPHRQPHFAHQRCSSYWLLLLRRHIDCHIVVCGNYCQRTDATASQGASALPWPAWRPSSPCMS